MAEQLSVETYQRAEALQAVRLHQGNIFRAQAIPARIGQSNSFWYRVSTQEGPRFMVVDADAAEKRDAFDHDAVAKALGATLGREVSGSALPIMGLDFSREGQVGLRLPGALYWWDATAAQLTADEHGATGFNEAASPDGRWAAYAENHDLYIRSLQNGERRQLTTDGELRCSYATHPEGIAWSHELEAMGFSMPPPRVEPGRHQVRNAAHGRTRHGRTLVCALIACRPGQADHAQQGLSHARGRAPVAHRLRTCGCRLG